MKGTTTIQLTDINTGKITEHKKENMLTHGFEVLLSRMPFFSTGQSPNIDNYLGGILCFANVQEENPFNFMLGADDNIVGHAGRTAYSGVDTLRGQINEAESDFTGENGMYRMVWDFGTDKSIGTISSLSLTQDKTGNKGLGISDSSAYSIIDTSTSFKTFTQSKQYVNPVILKDNDTLIQIGDINESGEFTITEYALYSNTITFNNFISMKVKNTVTKQLPQELLNFASTTDIIAIANCGDNESITFTKAGAFANNSSFVVAIMDRNYNFTVKNIVNTTGSSQYFAYSMYDLSSNKIAFANGIINLNDNSFIPFSRTLSSGEARGIVNGYLYNRGYVANLGNGNVSELILATGAFRMHLFEKTFLRDTGFAESTSYSFTQAYLPLLKTTINNLEEPVTKTEAQTMKIIYTLTL